MPSQCEKMTPEEIAKEFGLKNPLSFDRRVLPDGGDYGAADFKRFWRKENLISTKEAKERRWVRWVEKDGASPFQPMATKKSQEIDGRIFDTGCTMSPYYFLAAENTMAWEKFIRSNGQTDLVAYEIQPLMGVFKSYDWFTESNLAQYTCRKIRYIRKIGQMFGEHGTFFDEKFLEEIGGGGERDTYYEDGMKNLEKELSEVISEAVHALKSVDEDWNPSDRDILALDEHHDFWRISDAIEEAEILLREAVVICQGKKVKVWDGLEEIKHDLGKRRRERVEKDDMIYRRWRELKKEKS